MLSRESSWFHSYLAKTLSNGPIPQHVAFILDGNRRWARKNQLDLKYGHDRGAKIADNIVNFLDKMGVEEVTLYLFSIENFNRPKPEVDLLLDLVEDNLDQITAEFESKYRIKAIGDLSRLPNHIREKLEFVIKKTSENVGLTVNMAIAYTCRDDITQAIRKLMPIITETKDEQGEEVPIITKEHLEEQMYTNEMSKVDVLLRTSGETRLSDFLLWETGEAFLYFTETLWPDMGLWDIVKFILWYQRRYFQRTLSK